MKKKLLNSMRMLLVTAGLCVGTTSAWATTETVGESALNSTFRSANSTVYTLSGDGSVNLKFNMNNASGQHYYTYTLCVNDGSSTPGAANDYFCIMDMHYAYNGDKGTSGNSNANPTIYALTNGYTGSDLQAALNGAAVDLTVSRSGTAVTVSATFTPNNGESAFTSTFSYAATGGISSDNIGVYLTVENTYIYDLFAVTTKTYDFTSWVSEDTDVTIESTKHTDAFRQAMYLPSVYNGAAYFNSNFAFRYGTGVLKTTGLVLPKDNFLAVLNLTAGDKLKFTFSGSANLIHNRSGNYPNYSSMTIDGTELSGASSVALINNQTYFDYRDSRVAVRPTAETTFTGITVTHNTSTSYASLFELWKSMATIYAAAEASTAKTTFGTAIDAAKSVLSSATATEEDYADAIEALDEAYDVYQAALGNITYSVNLTDNIYGGKVIRRVAGITMTYGGTSGVAWTVEEPKDSKGNSRGIRAQNGANATVDSYVPSAGTYFTFTPTANGILTFYFLGYAGNRTAQQIHAILSDGTKELKNITFSNSYTIWTADFGVLEAGKTYYVYFTGGNDDVPGINKFTFEQSVSVTLPSSGYGSLASAYGLDFSSVEGLTAYVATSTSASAVTLTSVSELPANSGVILKGTPNATYSIPVKAAAAYDGTNLLGAAVTAYDCAENEVYILQGGKFHLVTAASTVPAGKAYLPATAVSSDAHALSFVFGEDETTGINNVNVNHNDNWYDLQGRRVAAPQKGLYIMNGKKFIIK